MKIGDSAVWFKTDDVRLSKVKKNDLKTTICIYANETEFKFDFDKFCSLKKEKEWNVTYYYLDNYKCCYYVFPNIEAFEIYIKYLKLQIKRTKDK
jgi:hypothetical protein